MQGPPCHGEAKSLGSTVHLHGGAHSSKLTSQRIARVLHHSKAAGPAWQPRVVRKMELYLCDRDGSGV